MKIIVAAKITESCQEHSTCDSKDREASATAVDVGSKQELQDMRDLYLYGDEFGEV